MINKKPESRIGLTMRIDSAPGSGEKRNSLAIDWQDFMCYALPEATWLPVPNVKDEVVNFLNKWNINGIILTGGNDLGSAPERDATEKVILSHCLSKKLRVFGICRGLQLIQSYFKGEIARIPNQAHVGKKHEVTFCQNSFIKGRSNNSIEVNSYHNYGVREDELSKELAPLAVTKDGWVEALVAKNHSIFAVLWHPERGRPFREYDRDMIRNFFTL